MPSEIRASDPIVLHCAVEIQPWAFQQMDKDRFGKAIDAELESTMKDMKEAFMRKYDELRSP